MRILAIETSCDETSAAVIDEKDSQPITLSNIVSSQIDLHTKYGGVVPEVAARAHIENVIPVIKEALIQSQKKYPFYAAAQNGYLKELLKDIDYIAVTYGPGLVGSLVVGVETAKALSVATGKPVLPVNHLEGHIYANFIQQAPNNKNQITNKLQIPKFPIIALLVSGGHSMLIYMKKHLDYKVIGQTRDDAAGEAFDKGAKILGLGYPGGPIISKEAEKGDAKKYDFPIIDLTEKPKRGKDGFMIYPKESLDFSFSGLKTALLTVTKQQSNGRLNNKTKADLAAGFQKAIVDTLVQNSLRAAREYKPKTFILSGGVAANRALREKLRESLPQNLDYRIPDPVLCTDNAAMIGAAAYYHIKNRDKRKETRLDRAVGQVSDINFSAEPNLKLK